MEFTILLVTLITLTSLAANESEIVSNTSPSQRAKEYGQVKNEDARSIPRAYCLGNQPLNFSFSAAYTLWSPYQGGMNLAASNILSVQITDLPPGNTISPKTFPKSGFKVAVEKYLHYDDWKAKVQYTWFYNKNSLNNREYNIERAYHSSWLPPSFPILDFADFSSSFNNQFNRIDGILFRELWLRETFVFTPTIGLVGAWEDQHLNIKAERQRLFIASLDLLYLTALQYWWCVGPYASFETTYRVIKHFSIFLKGGGSINLAKHDVYELEETAELRTPNTRSTIYNIEDHRWNTEPMLEATLGIKINYPSEKAICFISIGWECQNWFSHNGFIPASAKGPSSASYSMQGLTVDFGISF